VTQKQLVTERACDPLSLFLLAELTHNSGGQLAEGGRIEQQNKAGLREHSHSACPGLQTVM
jgi:hypothetical protein